MLPHARSRFAPLTATSAWARASAVGLVLALLLLQQLGLSHRYMHAPGAARSDISSGLPAHDKPACLVLDQLCIGDAVPALAMALPATPVVAVQLWVVLQRVLQAAPAAFQARGPPVFSL